MTEIEELQTLLTAERERADSAEGALRELGKHPEECADDGGACVSHLAYEDCTAERDALRDQVARLVGAIERYFEAKQYAMSYASLPDARDDIAEAFEQAELLMSTALEGE